MEPVRGYVYVLLEPANGTEVKIGFTTGSVGKRVAELFSTDRSRPLVPLWSAFVLDPQRLEARMHERFAAFRVSPAREFFSIPPQDAIAALMDEAEPFRLPDPSVTPGRTDVFLRLLKKFDAAYFASDLKAVSTVVTSSGVRLEVKKYAEESGGGTHQFELSFFSDWGFSNELSAEENAALFLELDLFKLAFIDGLLSPEKQKALWRENDQRKAGMDPAQDADP